MSPGSGSSLLLLLVVGVAAIILTAEASDIVPEKPGSCPKDVDYPSCNDPKETNKNECKIDKDCDGKMKCCFSACRKQCLLPLEDKKGACPYFNSSECILVLPLPNECQDDVQCPGSERCCYKDCRFKCEATVEEKPGECPIPSTRCAYPPPPPDCLSDADCLGDEKCCTPLCKMECTKPV